MFNVGISDYHLLASDLKMYGGHSAVIPQSQGSYEEADLRSNQAQIPWLLQWRIIAAWNENVQESISVKPVYN